MSYFQMEGGDLYFTNACATYPTKSPQCRTVGRATGGRGGSIKHEMAEADTRTLRSSEAAARLAVAAVNSQGTVLALRRCAQHACCTRAPGSWDRRPRGACAGEKWGPGV